LFPSLIVTTKDMSGAEKINIINLDRVEEISFEEDNTELSMMVTYQGRDEPCEMLFDKYQKASCSQTIELFDTDNGIYIATENPKEIVSMIKTAYHMTFKTFSEQEQPSNEGKKMENGNVEQKRV